MRLKNRLVSLAFERVMPRQWFTVTNDRDVVAGKRAQRGTEHRAGSPVVFTLCDRTLWLDIWPNGRECWIDRLQHCRQGSGRCHCRSPFSWSRVVLSYSGLSTCHPYSSCCVSWVSSVPWEASDISGWKRPMMYSLLRVDGSFRSCCNLRKAIRSRSRIIRRYQVA